MLTMTGALSSSYERLTRDNAALLLIDQQVGPLWELELAPQRRRVTALARVAERLGVPTIVTAIATLGDVQLPGCPRTRPTAPTRGIRQTPAFGAYNVLMIGASLLARGYAVAREVFDMRSFWSAVEDLDNHLAAETQLAMLIEGRRLVERATRWLYEERHVLFGCSRLAHGRALDTEVVARLFEQMR